MFSPLDLPFNCASLDTKLDLIRLGRQNGKKIQTDRVLLKLGQIGQNFKLETANFLPRGWLGNYVRGIHSKAGPDSPIRLAGTGF